MTALSLSPFSFLTWSFRKTELEVDDTFQIDDVERNEIAVDMISASACNSEYGAQMLMSLYPDQF